MIHDPKSGLLPGLLLNGLLIAIGLIALWLWNVDQDLYYLFVQEDQLLEWSSFWGFMLAGGLYGLATVRSGPGWVMRWFPAGLSLFCLFVAMEEISWGQRVFGYRPPDYFLEFNYQQEFNLHNVVDTAWRKIGFFIIVIGYGVVLPLLGRIKPFSTVLTRLGIRAPALSSVPAFALIGLLQQLYPLRFSGEWVELMLAFGFVFTARHYVDTANASPPFSPRLATQILFGAIWLPVLLGALSAAATSYQRQANPANEQAARAELTALAADLNRSRLSRIGCGVHRRVFTLATRNRVDDLFDGEFTALMQQGLPEARAEFFLDPWNTAYWLRFSCADDGRNATAYLYSFGPNRRRDSTRYEIGGDDLAVVIIGTVDRLSEETAQDTQD